MGQEVVELWHKDKDLSEFTTGDCIVLPGGFSYGDYLRSGAIARFSPIMEEVMKFAEKGGKTWGICNGFQILCEAGLLPGALLHNIDQQFICKNVYIKPSTTDSMLTNNMGTGDILKIPVAHAEGRYYAPEAVLDDLEKNDQVLFHYCDKEGKIVGEANSNGSVRNIAGICNKARNVCGIMPHPERAAEEALGNTDGIKVFEALLQAVHVA